MPALPPDLAEVNTAQDCMDAAQNFDLVTALEQTITGWCKEIEMVGRLLARRKMQHVKMKDIITTQSIPITPVERSNCR